MKKKILYLVLFLGLSFSSVNSVSASDWYWLRTDNTGVNYYVDNSSVKKNNSEAIVWLKKQFIDKSYILCMMKVTNYGTAAMYIQDHYDKYGRFAFRETYSGIEIPIPPDTLLYDKLIPLIW